MMDSMEPSNLPRRLEAHRTTLPVAPRLNASKTGALVVVACLILPLGSSSMAEPPAIDFTRDVAPILAKHCQSCHGVTKQKSGLRLDERAHALEGGANGPAIVPGNAKESLLFQAIIGQAGDLKMPPTGERLNPGEIESLRAWIDRGAQWPEQSTGLSTPDRSDWWSLRPLSRPEVPITQTIEQWIRNPIDAFILARLRESKLSFAPEADRRTLIRRVSLDLTGLPPSANEVDGFVSDPDPQAYERLVDRLLGSPQYGERWARHWLDLVHFAETHGHDQDRPRENAWPYRDYVINAFNADKPYARFVAEQIAADAVAPDHPELTPALGLLATGPWDESSLRDIREDTLDRQIGRYLDRDDIVTTVMSTFASTTVHCARCHDHKFDPISQEDYYALQAVFAGTEKADRLFDLDPGLHARRQRLMHWKVAAETRDQRLIDHVMTAEMLARMKRWEQRFAGTTVDWTVVAGEPPSSSGGTIFKRLDDGSFLASGPRPETESYSTTFPWPNAGLTALQIEVLPDDSLPHRGPGRQENGNLHLSEVRLEAIDEGGASPASPVKRIRLTRASSDFDQAGWGIARAIDGDPNTAWGVYPQVGKLHRAILEVDSRDLAGLGIGTRLRVTLEQLHGGRHTIGRFRISTTAHPSAPSAIGLPEEVATILKSPAASRSPEQRRNLTLHFLTDEAERESRDLPEPRRVYAGASLFPADAGHKPVGLPRRVQVLRRGEITKPIKDAVPGTLSCTSFSPARFSLENSENEALRRVALAKWLTDPNNPLTWRSIVNRVWHHHLGRGLVGTLNDFGHMGETPSHSLLLDWLATRFLDSGGSLKSLHRLIVTSATYRQSSQARREEMAVDADNRLLAHANRRKQEAEAIRDTLLALSGSLDLRMGGPSMKQFVMSPGIHVTPKVDYDAFPIDAHEHQRRAIYRFLFRTLPDPFMDALDCPAGDQSTPARGESYTALQAFAMLNDVFVLRQCERIAERLKQESPSAPEESLVHQCFRRILLRDPTPNELRDCYRFAREHGLANVCRILVNSNEFLFVD